MASNFLKRKEKTVETVAQEIMDKRAEVRSSVSPEETVEPDPEPVYDQMAYDIFTDNGGKAYKVAEISYNPATKQAEVKEIFTISRGVALQYANTKNALGTLKKKLIKA